MDRRVFALVWMGCLVGTALAQPPAPPERLPPTVLEPVSLSAPGPVSAAEAARQRDALVKSLKEEIVAFEPGAVTVRMVDGHWQVRTADVVLKDFGADRSSATEAVRLIHDLRLNQVGTVKGSNPSFEYWLADGKPPRVANTRAVVLPIMARSIRAENVGGTWVVTDGTKGLYDFGADAAAAQRAAAVYWKYGFNQLGVIGAPRPTMILPLADPVQAARERSSPTPMPNALGVLGDVARTSLLLPGNVYAGPKQPIDPNALQVARGDRGEVVLLHGDAMLARFGGSEVDGRAALRALKDGHVTEVAWVGSNRFPLFLTGGNAFHGEPLGATKTAIRADRLRAQRIRDTWWLTEDGRPVMEVGMRDDAELLLKVMQIYGIRAQCVIGRVETGGLRLLTTGR